MFAFIPVTLGQKKTADPKVRRSQIVMSSVGLEGELRTEEDFATEHVVCRRGCVGLL
jgi:hypothetical protein